MPLSTQEYQKIEGELGRRTYFPNGSEVAYFDPQSQTIHLKEITKAGFEAAVAGHELPTLRSHLSTMLHEITHWADLVATLWGRNYLRTVFNVLRLLPRINTPGSEYDYHQFIDLHDQTRRLMLSKYFRTVHPQPQPHDHRRPWRFQLSAGREFDPWGRPNDARPVMFVRFDDHNGRELIARQPLTVGALLELNAVWSELRTSAEVIQMMEQPQRALEEQLFKNERLGQLYDPRLTLYTAPAHLVARSVRTSDVNRAYHLGALVAHVVLNLQDEDFHKLTPPSGMTAWEPLMPGFRASHDPGFAFAAICMSGAAYSEERPADEWVDESLARVGLDSAAIILACAARTMEEEALPSGDNILGRAEGYLLRIGRDVLAARSAPDPALTLSVLEGRQLPVPPMYDPDGELLDLARGRFDTSAFPLDEAYFAGARLHTWTINFLDACR